MAGEECWVCGDSFERLAGHMSVHCESAIRAALLENLRQATDELGRVPTIQDMDYRLTEYPSADPYKRRWGSWNDALRAADLEPNMEGSWGVADEELLAEIERLADDLGHPPTQGEMDQKGAYASRTLENRFGSWSDSLLSADVDVSSRGLCVSDEALLESLHAIAEDIGRPPSANEVREKSEYGIVTYHRRFGSWLNALEKAGYDVSPGRPDALPSGPNHPDWEGGSFDYGTGWNPKKRRDVRERDGRKCVRCGMSEEDHLDEHGSVLHVHHVINAREFDEDEANERNAMDNLVSLCHGCHTAVHKGGKSVPVP